ncbi:Valine--pyruvate aminotransferase [Vermiconidia calcicola]|uniref:Valine--pyruvate aminotransferase n=1 Tax=Vermiconidia calcicola TaxID=1690605 RepID=A0ACC3NH63_9PEZI|nr:Valine--pyruvate aminotransferase [Vermiconidia calcicola]
MAADRARANKSDSRDKTSTDDQINLLRGWPNPKLLPASLIKDAAVSALSDSKIWTDGLLYGPDAGYEPLRESIAKWLTSFYQVRVGEITAKRICITGGASRNLGNMLAVFSDPEYTRKMWIVAPAYFLAFKIFQDAGFADKMRAVPEDDGGVDIEFLRREIVKSENQAKKDGTPEKPRFKHDRRAKVYKHIIYCVPTFANPSSRTMSLSRRKALLSLAREYDALVICDDVYDFLQWPADTSNEESVENLEHVQMALLPRLVDIDRDFEGGAERQGADGFGNACSNQTFTKVAAPGLRIGWVEGTEKFAYGVSQAGTTLSGGSESQATATYMHICLTQGEEQSRLQGHVRKTLRPAYARRYRILMHAIQEHLLPLGFQLPQSTRDIIGGYFTWLSLPEGMNAETLSRRCKEEVNVIVAAGKLFEVPGDERVKFDGNIRLCWSWEDESKLEEGVKRIGSVAKRMLAEGVNGEEYVVVEKERDDDMAQFK